MLRHRREHFGSRQRILVVAAAMALFVGIGSTFVAATWPEDEGTGGLYRLDRSRVEEVTDDGGAFCWVRPEVCIVEPRDGEFLVFHRTVGRAGDSRHCDIRWNESPALSLQRPEAGGLFEEGCWGTKWDVEGKRVFGPLPNDLARLDVAVQGDQIVVLPNCRPDSPCAAIHFNVANR